MMLGFPVCRHRRQDSPTGARSLLAEMLDDRLGVFYDAPACASGARVMKSVAIEGPNLRMPTFRTPGLRSGPGHPRQCLQCRE